MDKKEKEPEYSSHHCLAQEDVRFLHFIWTALSPLFLRADLYNGTPVNSPPLSSLSSVCALSTSFLLLCNKNAAKLQAKNNTYYLAALA